MEAKAQARSNRDQIIHDFDDSSKNKSVKSIKVSDGSKKEMTNSAKKIPLVLFLVLAVLGIATGYVFAQALGSSTVKVAGPGGSVSTATLEKGQTFGSDAKTFKDSAEGVMREGGIEGEGAFHLERPGGESQTVYLTSSIIDLSTFIGRKVKVWGETNAAQRAGWLMDVGRLQVL